jgi:hypothetical protein
MLYINKCRPFKKEVGGKTLPGDEKRNCFGVVCVCSECCYVIHHVYMNGKRSGRGKDGSVRVNGPAKPCACVKNTRNCIVYRTDRKLSMDRGRAIKGKTGHE